MHALFTHREKQHGEDGENNFPLLDSEDKNDDSDKSDDEDEKKDPEQD